MRKLAIIALTLLTFCLGAVFSYHNPEPVTLNYLAGSIDKPLGWILIAVLGFSWLLMAAIYALMSLPRRAEILNLKRKLSKAESELRSLRQIPLKDG